ncbi:MAG: YraN family protein, partial [Nitrospinota bacterium]|nr:YraN family protein [Nitrospinota bacterium]
LRLGKLGEDLAANKLASEGFRLVDRNLKVAGREVDIIAVEGEYLVFVEVKTRSDSSFGHPLLAVDNKRRIRLRQAAGMYAEKRGLRSVSIRFDVVTVEFRASSEARVELIRNAF